MDEVKDNTHSRIRTYTLVFGALVLGVFVLKSTSSFVIPIVIAFFLFIFVNPLLNKMDKMRFPRFLSMLIAMLLVFVVFVFFIYTLFAMVDALMRKLPAYVSKVNALDMMISNSLRNVMGVPEGQSFSILSRLNIDWFGFITSTLTSLSSKFISILGDCVLIYLYFLFIILERFTIFPKLIVALPADKGRKLSELIGRSNKLTSKYLELKLLISALTGVLFYVTAVFSGLDFPLVWGILAFLLNFIPTIGSIIVTAGAIFIAIVQFLPDWNKVAVIGFSLIAIQTILGNVIDPRLQGVKLNISPLIILISLAIWGYIWGVVGMFLAVPLTSILQIICASTDSLKPIAILLSTGSGYKEEAIKKEKRHRKNKKD